MAHRQHRQTLCMAFEIRPDLPAHYRLLLTPWSQPPCVLLGSQGGLSSPSAQSLRGPSHLPEAHTLQSPPSSCWVSAQPASDHSSNAPVMAPLLFILIATWLVLPRPAAFAEMSPLRWPSPTTSHSSFLHGLHLFGLLCVSRSGTWLHEGRTVTSTPGAPRAGSRGNEYRLTWHCSFRNSSGHLHRCFLLGAVNSTTSLQKWDVVSQSEVTGFPSCPAQHCGEVEIPGD